AAPVAKPAPQAARPQPTAAAPKPAPAKPAAADDNGSWISGLLARASRDDEPAAPAARKPAAPAAPQRSPLHAIESLDSLSVDIARMIDHQAVADLWDRYRRGERNVFTRRLYTLQGQQTFEEIRRKYGSEPEFRGTVDRYVTEFERLLAEIAEDDRDGMLTNTYLTSETGKVYTMLSHAAGKFDPR
ncbi:kinesin, partial [Methylopila henanensis]